MPTPVELLHAIQQEIQLAQDTREGFNQQQQPFASHLQQLTAQLLVVTKPMPQSQYALERLLPSLDETHLQKLDALVGYAKLLLESPQSFENTALTHEQQVHIQRVYDLGVTLAQLVDKIIQKSQIQRRERMSSAQSLDNLQDFLMDEDPVLRYFLREHPVKLVVMPASVPVMVSRYHLTHMMQHLVKTLAHELIEYGQIKITVDETQTTGVLDIFCTGITLNPAEMTVLFQKQGRYMYVQRFEGGGSKVQLLRHPGRGASIRLHCPKA